MQHLTVKCPTCGKEVQWIKKEKWRPFCSERCRLIDLGAWASDKYAIPGEEDSEVPEGEQKEGKEDEDV